MSKGLQTKSTILSQALARASKLGLESLSIGELAKAVGMSKSGLFAHFKSKETLQMKVLDLAAELMIKSVMEPAIKEPRGISRIRAIVTNWIDWNVKSLPGGCPFIAASAEFDDRPGKVRERVYQIQFQWIQTLKKSASIAVAEKQFQANADVDQFAYELYSLLMGFHHYKRMLGDPDAIARLNKSFDELLVRYAA